MRAVKSLSIVMLLLLAMQIGRGDDAKTLDLQHTDNLPLAVLVRDMERWKCFGLAEPGKAETAAGLGVSGTIFFTKGEMLPVGNELFLVAYRLPAQIIDYTQGMTLRALKADDLLEPGTELPISLLNLHTVNMLDIRPAELGWMQLLGDNAKVEVARYRAQLLMSISNLRQLGLAMLMCAQDHKNTLPAMNTPDELKEALKPYFGDAPQAERLWYDSITKQPYSTNPALSGVAGNSFQDPASIIALYSDVYPDGTRAVVFLDGHGEIVTPERWAEVDEQSGIPRQ